ncbi:MAG: hypothetical protein QF586_00630 [Arenicellales bacterium]|jgi:hypothetical protein|nr:hypothetical protein [Acidiferrobacteraceae bacterium]MDP6122605.1 hypothetical protein [Arenicellales bacterium]MBT58861.1 hypothetical protein [Acidiferrobacteraceae bacterium]MDP6288708.1 hypothetical protein [Arenicellales bacterium]MDP6434793.1 hypothetical protein [Arenicellales bacterium]|tara:strand:+ start:4298 stop:4522 length:225 start_codon:yes stop_codon:yes gene_type:complete
MDSITTIPATEFTGLYNLPGEGLVAELVVGTKAHLFDRQGLQHRIVHMKQEGVIAEVEELALAQMNAIGSPQLI